MSIDLPQGPPSNQGLPEDDEMRMTTPYKTWTRRRGQYFIEGLNKLFKAFKESRDAMVNHTDPTSPNYHMPKTQLMHLDINHALVSDYVRDGIFPVMIQLQAKFTLPRGRYREVRVTMEYDDILPQYKHEEDIITKLRVAIYESNPSLGPYTAHKFYTDFMLGFTGISYNEPAMRHDIDAVFRYLVSEEEVSKGFMFDVPEVEHFLIMTVKRREEEPYDPSRPGQKPLRPY